MPASDLVQSLSRGLSVLECIASSEVGATLREVCDATGLKGPTAHNLLRTLVAHAYIEKLEGPVRYRLGPAAMRLRDGTRSQRLQRRVRETLKALAAGWPMVRFSFAEDVGGEVVATLRATPEGSGRVLEGIEQPMSPYASASALVHQALWPEEKREAYRRRYPLAEYGAHQWRSVGELDDYLGRVRREGFALPRITHDEHLRLAVPVRDGRWQLVGALGAYLPGGLAAPEREQTRLQTAVIAAAARVQENASL